MSGYKFTPFKTQSSPDVKVGEQSSLLTEVPDLPYAAVRIPVPLDVIALDHDVIETYKCRGGEVVDLTYEYRFMIGVTAYQADDVFHVPEYLLEYFKGHLEQAGIAYEVPAV